MTYKEYVILTKKYNFRHVQNQLPTLTFSEYKLLQKTFKQNSYIIGGKKKWTSSTKI